MKILFTKQGLEKLKKNREYLVNERPPAVLDLKKARDMGDLSENGYYKSARAKLNDIDRNIRQFNYLIKFAVVAYDPKNGLISIGSKINLEIADHTREYLIVGAYEANPSEGKMSFVSPIGKALLGKKTGDTVDIETPSGTKQAKIIKVNP